MASNKYTIWKKIGLVFINTLLIFNVVFSTCNLAQAYSSSSFSFGEGTGGFSIPEPISVVDDMLQKFNIDSSSIANMSQQLNVSEQKTTFPEVSIFFNPSDPKSGQKITAQASPMYFSTPEEKLYFTWYVKHKKDAEGKHGFEDCEKKSYDENCDWNGKNGIDEEDWKIEAMRLIAQSGYDNNFDEPKPDYNNDNDSDGYFAPLGGGDKIKDEDSGESTPAYCYIGDFSSGTKYKISQTSDTESEANYELSCPSGSSAYCLKTSSDTCLGTEITSGNERCELVGNTMTATCTMLNGDTGTPTCVDDTIDSDSNLFSDGIFKYRRVFDGGDPPGIPTSCKYGNKKCFDTVDNSSCFLTDNVYDSGTGIYTETLREGSFTCDANSTSYDEYLIDDWEDFMTGRGRSLSGFGCGYSAGNYQSLVAPTCTLTGETYDGDGCKHLFPDTENNNWEVGDGDFKGNEEKFWGTNPQDPNTAGNGNLDEANISGLGQKQFSWIFQEGDKVGVIVEGTSMLPTKYNDGSYAIMWALPKNIFKIENSDSEVGYAKGFAFNVPTASNTINDSLEDNLVDPAGKKNDKLELSLTYSPDNPINDSSGDEMGDLLSINSIVGNTSQNFSQLYYDWKILIGKGNSGNFSDISSKLIGDNLIDGNLSGINNSNVNVRLNLGEKYKEYFDNSGIGYLKIINTVKETTKKYGKEEVIIKINSTGKKIRTYLITSRDGNILTVSKDGSVDNVICNNKENSTSSEKLASYICPVVKNQVLKLVVDKDGMTDFAWKVNGSSYICDSNIFDCSGGSAIFLPIIGNEGDKISVTVSGKDMDVDNGKSIELTKSFQIVKPYVKIISITPDTFWPKLLGKYSDLNGNQYPDYSDSLFETYSGMKNISLKAEFHPIWLPKIGVISANWTLDGEQKTDIENPQEIEFDADKNVGEYYDVEFKSFYSSSNEIRKALNKYWGVSQNESEGEVLATSVRGDVIDVDSPAGTTGMLNKSGKFLASIASNFPSQAIFLLRMALVIFVIIFLSGIAFNLSPEFLKNKK